MKEIDYKGFIFKVIIAFILLSSIVVFCLMIGNHEVSILKALKDILMPEKSLDYKIIFKIRLPRILMACICGTALSCSGVVLQAILRNPLSEPYILGISSGAGLGTILAVISGLSFSFLGFSSVSVFAFTGAILTVWLVWVVGSMSGKGQVTGLLLSGVIVNAFLSAIIMFLTSITDSGKVYSTIFWLMGNIQMQSYTVVIANALLVLIGCLGLFVISPSLNAISFGEEHAISLGVNTSRTIFIGFAISAFITSVSVSNAGLIGFVGLIVPHAVRSMTGPDNRMLIPISAFAGAAFLAIADTMSRVLISPAQLPVGVITAIIGGPFFLYLLSRSSKLGKTIR